jgi:hypothetical protein
MAAFLLVPGAWLGGWCWRDVAPRPGIGLDTHVADIVDLLHHQDLNDVTQLLAAALAGLA